MSTGSYMHTEEGFDVDKGSDPQEWCLLRHHIVR